MRLFSRDLLLCKLNLFTPPQLQSGQLIWTVLSAIDTLESGDYLIWILFSGFALRLFKSNNHIILGVCLTHSTHNLQNIGYPLVAPTPYRHRIPTGRTHTLQNTGYPLIVAAPGYSVGTSGLAVVAARVDQQFVPHDLLALHLLVVLLLQAQDEQGTAHSCRKKITIDCPPSAAHIRCMCSMVSPLLLGYFYEDHVRVFMALGIIG